MIGPTMLIVTALAGAAVAQNPVDDATAIQGSWMMVALEKGGIRDTTNKNVNNTTIVFGADGYYAVKPTGFEFPGHYRITPSVRALDITVNDRTVLARYELQDDELRVCEGTNSRPPGMIASECRHGAVTVYRRQK